MQRSKASLTSRPVLPFSMQAYKKGTKILNMPQSDLVNGISGGKTYFVLCYEARRLPIAVDNSQSRPNVRWLADLTKLDREFYLPIFFSGLIETIHPYRMLVYEGIRQLLPNSENQILRSLPKIAYHVRGALKKNSAAVVVNVCSALKWLAETSQPIALALVQYHKGMLIELGKWKDRNINLMDLINNRRVNIRNVVEDTLEVLEICGGAKAYVEIKLAIPTFTSCLHN